MLSQSNRVNLLVLIIALLATACLVLAISVYGLGLTNDSVAYMAAAKSFYTQGRFFLPYRENYYTDWPPLFSILLSSLYFIKVDHLLFTYSIVAVFLYFAVVYTFGCLAYRLTRSRLYTALGMVIFVAGPPTFISFSYLWSEAPFILFTIMFLVGLDRCLGEQKFGILLFTAVAASLSIMVRYAGVVNIGIGAFFLFVYTNGGLVKRLKPTLLFVSVALFPLAGWFYRNYLISSTLTGAGRTVALSHFSYTVVTTAKAVWEWFLPFPPYTFAGMLTIVACASVFTLLAFAVATMYRRHFVERRLLMILFASTLLYLFLNFITALFRSSEFPNARLTSPAFFSFVLVLISIVSYWVRNGNAFFKTAVAAVVAVLLLFNLPKYVQYIRQGITTGLSGHSDKASRNSPLVHALQQSDWLAPYVQREIAFTNAPEKLYYYGLLGIRKTNVDYRLDLTDAFQYTTEEKLLIWFSTVDNAERLHTILKDTLQQYEVVREEKYADGKILWLKLKQNSSLH
ncbi:ArnT family glycosyltransferase [Pontibacter mangrovi]|uniref:Glycosyltransferase RgtA/B/C/D-like domain-containing protein n=1 Tax=Pontibacter mangrovi TaxID=2589816 RepID=A0A501WAE8_9BACT|nr:hypothetical protein [Pontibacter mangrovi]TPE45782.1 hypothetical protein FJM65_00070 [Pontibacter mangrovi]